MYNIPLFTKAKIHSYYLPSIESNLIGSLALIYQVKKIFLISFIALLIANTYAQKVTPKYTFNVELTLPEATANAPFNDIMQGLVSTSLYGQYSFPFHFHIGAGIKYSLFTINEFAVPSPVYGNMQTGVGFVKLGWDKFHNERFATDFGVKVGYSESFIFSDTLLNDGIDPYQYRASSPLVEGTMGLILTADEKSSYRMVLGYGVLGFGFNPQMISLNSNEGYDPSKFNKLTQYFIVGFGFTHYFNSKTASD